MNREEETPENKDAGKLIKLVTTHKCKEVTPLDIAVHENQWNKKHFPIMLRITRKETQIKDTEEKIKKLESKVIELENEVRKLDNQRFHRFPTPIDVQWSNRVKEIGATAFRAIKAIGKHDGQTSYLIEFLIDGEWYCETSTEDNWTERNLTLSSSLSKGK